MALLGRPKLGDTVRTQLRVKESKEFKVLIFYNFNHVLNINKMTL